MNAAAPPDEREPAVRGPLLAPAPEALLTVREIMTGGFSREPEPAADHPAPFPSHAAPVPTPHGAPRGVARHWETMARDFFVSPPLTPAPQRETPAGRPGARGRLPRPGVLLALSAVAALVLIGLTAR